MNNVKLTDNHLTVIAKAVEVYYRLKSGQIHIALDIAFDSKCSVEDTYSIERLVRSYTHPMLSPHVSYGYNCIEMGDARIGYEIWQTFMQYLSVKGNNGYYDNALKGGCSGDILKASDEPLPVFTDFKQYKDFKLNKRQSKKILAFKDKKQYTEMWNYIVSQREVCKLPSGENTEIIVDGAHVILRVFKPRMTK